MAREYQGGIMKSNRAFIGVDFVVDFIDGKFGSENARKVATKAEEFLKKIDSSETVVLTLDSHMTNFVVISKNGSSSFSPFSGI